MTPQDELHGYLKELQLTWPRENYQALAEQALKEHWPYADYLARLLEGECHRRRENRIQRRIQAARFPVLKTLETFNWSWPKKIDRVHVQDLFRLAFLEKPANVIFLGGVGLGKTHLATALAHQACLEGHSVLLWFNALFDGIMCVIKDGKEQSICEFVDGVEQRMETAGPRQVGVRAALLNR